MYQKMTQLMDSFTGDTFLILQMIQLASTIKALEKKIKLNATSPEIIPLQKELQEKINERNMVEQQLEKGHANSALILHIISLQNEIWDLEQDESRTGQPSLQLNKRILDLQEQLKRKISELQTKGDANSPVLELIFVNSKIAALQKLITVHFQRSKNNVVDYERQRRQKFDLLKKKIVQLGHDEKNTELTKEIMILQSEMDHLIKLISNAKNLSDSQLNELRSILEHEKKLQENLQRQLQQTDYAQAESIMRLITIMKELREMKIDEKQPNTSYVTSLQAQLQAKQRDYEKAQAEIKDLQNKLRLITDEYSGFAEKYKQVKTEYEKKIEELKNTGDSKSATILNIMNLHIELKNLRDQIATATNPERLTELVRKLEEKQRELDSKNRDIDGLSNHKTILAIIELQNEIWDLQTKPANETTINHLKELQTRLDRFVTEIDGAGDQNAKLLLKITTLQSQVEWLQRQLSNLQALKVTQVTWLKNELTAKTMELEKYVNDLTEMNQTNTLLILRITNLHKELRSLEDERRNDNTTFYLTTTQLRDQLRAKNAQHIHDQAEIKNLMHLLQAKEREHANAQAKVKELERNLQLQTQNCSILQEKYKQVKTEFEQKILELNRTGDSKTALILNVVNLQNELTSLRNQIASTGEPDKILVLKKQLERKQAELNSKTADIKRLYANPQIILTIIKLQDEIWDLQKNATNGTTSKRIEELQTRLNGFLSEIDGDDSTKLTLTIMKLQSEVELLQRRLSDLQGQTTTEVTKLTNDLKTKKDELQNYITELNKKNQENAELILSISNLNTQLRNLEEEKQTVDATASDTVTKLKEQLQIKEQRHIHDQAQIQALQNKLNQTEAECSGYRQKITELQSTLDDKIKELLSKSDNVTTIALHVYTLTQQVEEYKKELQNTNSTARIAELQKLIDEKSTELATRTEQLENKSGQAQRFLQIIILQKEIEKYVNVAVNNTDYYKIARFQDQVNELIDGIEDEKDENTRLTFQLIAQQAEVAILKKQEESQNKAYAEKIKGLQDELDDVRKQIHEKTQQLESSHVWIVNLSAQIVELNLKIKPLEDEISYLKETHAEDLAEFERRMNLKTKQLQDSELRLKKADEKHFKSIMEIADLREQLRRAQHQASKAVKKNINELEQQLQTQQQENKKLENTNKDLSQEARNLRMCCNDASTKCEDIQKQLQQSQEDMDRLLLQQQERDDTLKNLQDELKKQSQMTNKLQQDYKNMESQLQQTQDNADNLQEQLREKDARFNQLQQNLENQITEKKKIQDDYNKLQNEKNELEETVQELQTKRDEEEARTIHTKKMTFDPNTAHPRIVLSADNTQMSPTDEIQNVPDNPGRFDVVLAVLGTPGFSSGRHYWEVSVAGKICYHIGMASESAPRKGTILFNPAKGYWTIILNKQGQYRAVDRRPAIIPVKMQPNTLGILLDYKKGQISFYDASDRSHMYSFVGETFTEKIYPFINFCVEDVENQAPITLLPPGSTDWITQ
uniref:myosin-11 n=1 Tax=Monopterus albus TaxID=43700 RepID=UPI0009B35F86|nr:myosin-11-like [Monopterus albus]